MRDDDPVGGSEANTADGSEAEPTDDIPDLPVTDDRTPDIPPEAVSETERLTRLAREATDPDAVAHYRDRRDEVAAEHNYTTRVRDRDETLVLYPAEWVEDGTVQFDRIETTDRAVEVTLSGPGDADRFRAVAAVNDAVVDAVAELANERDTAISEPNDTTPETHVATARTFAAFMSNHYVRPIDEATPEMKAEFRSEFLPRNGWPTDAQLAVLDTSLSLIERAARELDPALEDDVEDGSDSVQDGADVVQDGPN